jgi:hypothetical protein
MANQNQRPGEQQQGQGKQAGPVLPEGEKVGEWSEDEEDPGMGAGGAAEEGGGGFNSPGSSSGSQGQAPGKSADQSPKK